MRVRSEAPECGGVLATNPSALHWSQATSLSLQPGLVGQGADMSDEIDWGFSGSDNAKAGRFSRSRLFAQRRPVHPGASVWQVMAMVNQVARALPGGPSPLDDGMPGG